MESVQLHPLALGVMPYASSRFVSVLGAGQLSITRVLLDDGEADVAALPRREQRPPVYCPFCGERGIYRHFQNDTKRPHFAHASGDTCVASALETILHRRAKALLVEGLAQLRLRRAPLLALVPCLRCKASTAATLLQPAEWSAESEEVPLSDLRLDVATLDLGSVTAAFEVCASSPVSDAKAAVFATNGLPALEFHATDLLDAQTGAARWWPTAPLPFAKRQWHVERPGRPFAVCPACRKPPREAQELTTLLEEVRAGRVKDVLTQGVAPAAAQHFGTLPVTRRVELWQAPELLPWDAGARVARIPPDALVSSEARELAERLRHPYDEAFAIAKREKEVPPELLQRSETDWRALLPSAQALHSDVRRRTRVLSHVAKQAMRGHTAVSAAALVEAVRRFAPGEAVKLGADLEALCFTSKPLVGWSGYVGFPALVHAERGLYARVRARAARPDLRQPFPTTSERDAAIVLAYTRAFSLITGGPGTGKTTAVRGFLEYLEREREMLPPEDEPPRWLLCAPTHKALSRLRAGLTGFPFVDFRTVQAAVLKEFRTPPAGVLIDEASFLDSELAAALFEKFESTPQIVLVGDPDQLPSIAPGAVLRDLIDLFPGSVQRLTQNHRSEGRALAQAAQVLNAGRVPESTPGEVDIVSLSGSESVEAQALRWYRTLASGRDAGSVQVLAARRTTVRALNRRLQQEQNPDGKPLLGTHLREGDAVVVTQIEDFSRASGLHRGLMGTIHLAADSKLKLRLPDSIEVPVDLEAVSVEPSYAMTVHRSQGSEWPCILLVLDHFVSRNLLYTAFTRARSRVVILGSTRQLTDSLRYPVTRQTALSTGVTPSKLVSRNRREMSASSPGA